MAKPIQEKVIQSIQTSKDLYHKLVLLVGDSGSGKTNILGHAACNLGVKVINVNMVLSTELLELTPKQRALRLPGIMEQIADIEKNVVVLDNLEILFDKNLKQDPLRLLQGISRNHSVLASWNGNITNGKLNYAEPGHSEHRSYNMADLVVVSMGGEQIANRTQQ